ncbi:hypothetical protein TcWFU_009582 [Taenia crassiceps]|uniref:Uncharacterized protein n=1 Tax=Taenia crassiceps TaxID=6207 RepID=A0ABR4Q4Q9_9CEST
MDGMRDRYLDRAHFGTNNPDNKRRNELRQLGDWIEKIRAPYEDIIGTLFPHECCCTSVSPARRIQRKYCF